MSLTAKPTALTTLSRVEFIALMASLMALNALAIDIMLPGLQQIGASLGVMEENHRQYVITTYLIGMGTAQLAYGPLSDRFGRRTPLLIGLGIYAISALLMAFVPSFAALLMLRFTQGIGAAATRVISVSTVRDIYGGRKMAEVMSLIMMVFMVVPVIAPSIGQGILIFAEWHMIFAFMGAVALGVSIWVFVRLPETMAPEDRRPLSVASVKLAFGTVLTNRISLLYTLAASFIFGALFGFINSAQQIMVGNYGLGVWFPLVFAGFAVLMAASSFTNSRLVGRFGMRRLSHTALIGFLVVTFLWMISSFFGPLPFWLFGLFYAGSMVQFGLIGANFNAMAMEPLGHVAGTASAVLGFTQTVGGGLIGAVIGQAYDGTIRPLATGFFSVALIGFVLVLIAERGRLFHSPVIKTEN